MKTVRGLFFLLLLYSFLGPSEVNGEDWTTTDGKTYQNVKIIKIEPDSVTILDQDGGATIDPANLPANIQKELNYDPKEAASATAKKFQEQVQAITAKQRIEDFKKSSPTFQYDNIQDSVTIDFPLYSERNFSIEMGWSNSGHTLQYPDHVAVIYSCQDFSQPNNIFFCINNKIRFSLVNPRAEQSLSIFILDPLQFLYFSNPTSVVIEANGNSYQLSDDQVQKLWHFMRYANSLYIQQ